MRREDPPDRIQGRKAPLEVVRKTSNGALFIPAKNLPNGNERTHHTCTLLENQWLWGGDISCSCKEKALIYVEWQANIHWKN